MYIRKGLELLMFIVVSFCFINNAYGTLDFQINPSGGGTITITSCTEGTCNPTPPITCPPSCSLTCQDPNTQGFCTANYTAATNAGYTFLGFDICGQQISPEQNPWASDWSEEDSSCTITAHFQKVESVPTMTEWGMIIFIILAGLGSAVYLRRQKKVQR